MTYESTVLRKDLRVDFIDCEKGLFDPVILSCFTTDLDGIFDRAGVQREWLMDCRKGLATSQYLQHAADWFVSVLDSLDVDQIVIKGYGAYLLAGSILVTSYKPLKAGIIREEAKGYDKDNIIEGDVDPTKPILLVDDILNSGTSSISAIKTLNNNGFKNISAAFLLKFCMTRDAAVELNKRGVHLIKHAMEVNKI